MKKKKFLTILIVCLIILLMPVCVLCTGLALPPQFGETYYAELGDMYDKLCSTKNKKIILLGNSNIAFGVNSALLEAELKKDNFDYTVCNFGLYGALGTKAMLDLSEKHIKEGDIILFIPEPVTQSMSLYFSASEMWRALDSNLNMFADLKDKSSLIANFTSYTAEKYSFYKGKNVNTSGIYKKASFDKNCDMTQGERDYNIMLGGFDDNDLIDFDLTLLDDDFLTYVNEYNSVIEKRGAKMYWSFCPVNSEGLAKDCSREKIDLFYDYVSEEINFPLLGDPHNYIMDWEWFYDSNVHLNNSGAIVRTAKLLDDIKVVLGSTSSNDFTLPEKPIVPEQEDFDGNNSYAEYFEYEESAFGLEITGLKESGKNLKEIVIPTSYGGKAITSFSAEVFKGNTTLEKIVIQPNIIRLRDGCFNGCTSLREIVLQQLNPEKIGVGYDLLEGAPQSNIFVSEEAYYLYSTNYFWQKYSDNLYIQTN